MWFRRMCITLGLILVISGLLAGIMLLGAWLSLFGIWVVFVGAIGLGLLLTGFFIYMLIGYPQDLADLEGK